MKRYLYTKDFRFENQESCAGICSAREVQSDEVGRQHKDGLVTLLNEIDDVLHNALARDKVPLMEANPDVIFL